MLKIKRNILGVYRSDTLQTIRFVCWINQMSHQLSFYLFVKCCHIEFFPFSFALMMLFTDENERIFHINDTFCVHSFFAVIIRYYYCCWSIINKFVFSSSILSDSLTIFIWQSDGEKIKTQTDRLVVGFSVVSSVQRQWIENKHS